MRTGSPAGSRKGKTNSSQNSPKGSNSGCSGGQLYIIGIGPGDIEQMSLKAYRRLQQVEIVVGYNRYLQLVEELLTAGQETFSTGMRGEVERAEKALELAAAGKQVAVISSGDAGIYGMAGLLLEMAVKRDFAPEVEVIPGITAANAAASSLGAPLMHDHAAISLSDLLTPWPVIEKRLQAVAESDLVTVLYNPRSRQRVEQIKKAREIFLTFRESDTPVGIVRSASRGTEEVTVTSLSAMLEHRIDMLTVVIIGNSSTFTATGLMITPRGYEV